MAKRGRKPASNTERAAKGFFRPSRHGTMSTPAGKPPLKPEGMSEAVSEKWDTLVMALGSRLSPSDGTQLEQLARWCVEVDRLLTVLEALTPGTPEHGRTLRAAAAAAAIRNSLAARFGLDPVGRIRLPEAKAMSEFDRLEKKFFGDSK